MDFRKFGYAEFYLRPLPLSVNWYPEQKIQFLKLSVLPNIPSEKLILMSILFIPLRKEVFTCIINL